MNKTPKQILIDALHILYNGDNWCQGRTTDGEGRYCASGALMAAEGSLTTPEGAKAFSLLMRGVGWVKGVTDHRGRPAPCGIMVFNDDPERSFEDIRLAFKWAIEAA